MVEYNINGYRVVQEVMVLDGAFNNTYERGILDNVPQS